MARQEASPRDASGAQLATMDKMDKRLQERLLRLRGKRFTDELIGRVEQLPDLQSRLYVRDGEEVEAFARDLASDKKLRDQRIARQLRGEGARAPQAELLPGDTRD
jgi:hypothetical protein